MFSAIAVAVVRSGDEDKVSHHPASKLECAYWVVTYEDDG